MNNQRGAALVIVLGVIMMLMIFGSVLAAQTTQTQKQLETTERHIDARNIARMGQVKAQTAVKRVCKRYMSSNGTLEVSKLEEIKSNIIKDLKNVEDRIKEAVELDKGRSYKVTNFNYGWESNSLKVNIVSEGKSFNMSATENDEFTIELTAK